MSILVDRNTRVLCQGITGRAGQFHTRHCIEYGTQVVAGTHPNKAGTDVDGVPIFASVGDAVELTFDIAEGYYLYRHKFEFVLEPVQGVTLQPAQIPEGEHKTDEFFGEIQVFHDAANAVIPLQRSGSAATPVSLTLKYQGCAEIGVCYPPMSRSFELLLPAATAAGWFTADGKGLR